MITATVVYIQSDNTLWIAIATVVAALIAVLGSIAVAVITKRQKHTNENVGQIVDWLRTSNGTTIANYVENMAKTQKDE